jgi:hypothetical protein
MYKCYRRTHTFGAVDVLHLGAIGAGVPAEVKSLATCTDYLSVKANSVPVESPSGEDVWARI